MQRVQKEGSAGARLLIIDDIAEVLEEVKEAN
jgi:hypothetical protein